MYIINMLNVTRRKKSLAENNKTSKYTINQDTGQISERENERNDFRGVESEREILTSVRIEKTHREKEKQKEFPIDKFAKLLPMP